MKAMILAAGKGKRMLPLTQHTPKPLLKAQGKPLIVHTIERLKAAGFLELVINTAYLGDQISQALGDGSQYGVQIQYSRETEGLETGGGIQQALPLLKGGSDESNEPFLLINSDVWTDMDLSALKTNFKNLLNKNNLAHLVLVKNPEHNLQGDFCLQEGMTFLKGENAQLTALTYSGVAFIYPHLLRYAPDAKKFPLLPLLKKAIIKQEVSAEVYEGLWVDVGTPERLEILNKTNA